MIGLGLEGWLRGALLCALVAGAISPRSAWAQSSSADKSVAAQVLFDDAKRLIQKGDAARGVSEVRGERAARTRCRHQAQPGRLLRTHWAQRERLGPVLGGRIRHEAQRSGRAAKDGSRSRRCTSNPSCRS